MTMDAHTSLILRQLMFKYYLFTPSSRMLLILDLLYPLAAISQLQLIRDNLWRNGTYHRVNIQTSKFTCQCCSLI